MSRSLAGSKLSAIWTAMMIGSLLAIIDGASSPADMLSVVSGDILDP